MEKQAGGLITDFANNEIFYGKKDFKNPSLILKGYNLKKADKIDFGLQSSDISEVIG